MNYTDFWLPLIFCALVWGALCYLIGHGHGYADCEQRTRGKK